MTGRAGREASPAVDGELTFIGNATVLLRVGAFTILTDPNFLHRGDHAKLGGGLRSRRLTEPAVRITDLPEIDVVVLSHHHGDHFDEIAARDLDADLPILTTHHAAKKLRRQGFRRPLALDTSQTHTVPKGSETVRVTSLPGKHAPRPPAKVLPPVMGSPLEFDTGSRDAPFRIYPTGDTPVHDRLREISQRCPDIDLALLHLGGTKVLGIRLTMDASQGIAMLRLVRPRSAVPIRFDDCTVFRSPFEDFQRAVADADLETTVSYIAHGDTYRLDRSP